MSERATGRGYAHGLSAPPLLAPALARDAVVELALELRVPEIVGDDAVRGGIQAGAARRRERVRGAGDGEDGVRQARREGGQRTGGSNDLGRSARGMKARGTRRAVGADGQG